jgi:hypothetical protein
MTLKRKDVIVSRIHGSTEWSRWKLLCLAVLASSVMACKSSGTPEPSKSAGITGQCLMVPLQPQPSLTYILTCDGFSPKDQRIIAGAQVTFLSECDGEVSMSFSNPSTLFTSGAQIILLKDKGDQQVETAGSQGGCHKMCFGTATCPSEDETSKTGNLDVYTSGDPGATPTK